MKPSLDAQSTPFPRGKHLVSSLFCKLSLKIIGTVMEPAKQGLTKHGVQEWLGETGRPNHSAVAWRGDILLCQWR